MALAFELAVIIRVSERVRDFKRGLRDKSYLAERPHAERPEHTEALTQPVLITRAVECSHADPLQIG
jgi:hypothetical protein